MLQDCLVKQGLTVQQSEALINSANRVSNNVSHHIRLALNFLQDQVKLCHLMLNLLQNLRFSVLNFDLMCILTSTYLCFKSDLHV